MKKKGEPQEKILSPTIRSWTPFFSFQKSKADYARHKRKAVERGEENLRGMYFSNNNQCVFSCIDWRMTHDDSNRLFQKKELKYINNPATQKNLVSSDFFSFFPEKVSHIRDPSSNQLTFVSSACKRERKSVCHAAPLRLPILFYCSLSLSLSKNNFS